MQICEELDLIEAVQLLGDFNVNVLPLQGYFQLLVVYFTNLAYFILTYCKFIVRKHDQRMDFIEECLKAKQRNYKSCHRLLQLAETLRIYGEDKTKREGEVIY